MKNSLLTLLFSFIFFATFSQVPVITCLEVKTNGNVEINWLSYSGENFESYRLMHSTDNNSYSKIFTTNDISKTNYIHIGATADLSSQFYKLKIYHGGDSSESEIYQTIFLFLDASQPGKAVLSWIPPNSLSNNKYIIWRKLPFSDWLIIADGITSTFYNDIIEDGICEIYINYRVEIINEYDCSYRSNNQGATFTESIYPIKPVFDSISINYSSIGTPYIIFGWHASVSQDVVGYVIDKQIGNAWISFDTIIGIATYYIDSSTNVCDTVHRYAVHSLDSCGNLSPPSNSEQYRNIHFKNLLYDPCALTITLEWEPYIDPHAIAVVYRYGVWKYPGKLNFLDLEQVSEKYFVNYRSIDIQFVVEDINYNLNYDIVIQAVIIRDDDTITSSSCIKSIYTYGYEKPSYSYFANADVLPNYDIELTIDYDTLVKNSSLEVWRSDPGDDFLTHLMTISVDTLTVSPLQVVDTSADGSKGYYRYGIKVMDSCGKKQLESNRLKTIGLSAWIKDKNNNLLQWNVFKGWDAGVDKFFIYRMENAFEPTTPIDSVYGYEEEYTDDISSISGSVENLVYWVQAVERDGNEFREKSNSNRTIVIPESDIYFPNAFKPGGTDPFFKPVFRFLNGTNYLFQIYNRWGQLIFETIDPYNGWDGTYKGTYVQQGVYIYKFQYLDVYGNSTNERGTVTVIY